MSRPTPPKTLPGAEAPTLERAPLWRVGYAELRRIALLLVATAIGGGAWWLAWEIRFDFAPPADYRRLEAATLPMAALFAAITAQVMGLHRSSWRYAGLQDMFAIARAGLVQAAALLALVTIAADIRAFPRSVFVLFILLYGGLLGGLRLAIRVWFDSRSAGRRGEALRILVVGAGDTAELLLRQLRGRSSLALDPVALLDDDPAKRGTRLHGVPVAGRVVDILKVVNRYTPQEIVIATPSANGAQMRRIIDACRATGLPYRLMPPTEEVLAGAVNWRQLRQVSIEDLLRREPIILDIGSVAGLLEDRVVLVTGAGGSIGAELCRQIAHWRPRLLVMVEKAENPLFHLDREMSQSFPGLRRALVIADVTDEERMLSVMRRHRPLIVLHAAAHKHVPLMEANAPEAVRNNVFGTRSAARAAGRAGVERFVLISTDKAVRPSSVMGCTKRVAELVIQDLQDEFPETCMAAVRFGNVLGSNGSVVPIFRAQIEAGGPITVTHPQMTRYFMTIPEATRLVLQAAALATRSEVFILDMGEPVRIVDLARDLIRLSGLEAGVDIEIKFSGMRPGEKLYEELLLDTERNRRTPHEKIFVGHVEPPDRAALRDGLTLMERAVKADDELSIRRLLARLVPEATVRVSASESGTVPIVEDGPAATP